MEIKQTVKIVKYSNKRKDIREIKLIEANIGNEFEIVEIDNNDKEIPFKIYVPEYCRKYLWLSTDEFELVTNEL